LGEDVAPAGAPRPALCGARAHKGRSESAPRRKAPPTSWRDIFRGRAAVMRRASPLPFGRGAGVRVPPAAPSCLRRVIQRFALMLTRGQVKALRRKAPSISCLQTFRSREAVKGAPPARRRRRARPLTASRLRNKGRHEGDGAGWARGAGRREDLAPAADREIAQFVSRPVMPGTYSVFPNARVSVVSGGLFDPSSRLAAGS